jgi:hypothetical protein
VADSDQAIPKRLHNTVASRSATRCSTCTKCGAIVVVALLVEVDEVDILIEESAGFDADAQGRPLTIHRC